MTNHKSIEQLLAERESKMYRYYKHVFEDGFEGGCSMEYDEPIVAYIQQERNTQRIADLESVVEMVEGMKEKHEKHSDDSSWCSVCGRNHALSDVATRLRSEIESLKA